MGCGFYGYNGFYGSPWGSITTLAFKFILIVLAIKLVMKMFKGYKDNKDNKDSRDIVNMLDQMFIKGEISEDEYKSKKRIILEGRN